MRSTAIAAGLGVLSIQACGSGGPPAKIGATAINNPVIGSQPNRIEGQVFDAEGTVLPLEKVNYVATPVDVGVVTADGVFVCSKSGKAQITMSSGALVETIAVDCAVPTRINLDPSTTLVVSDDWTYVDVQAADGIGVLPTVPVAITSSDTSVIEIKDGALKAKTAGTARLTFTAGSIEKSADYIVAEAGSIQLDDPLHVQIGATPPTAARARNKRLNIGVLSLDGTPIKGAPYRVSISDLTVAEFKDGQLTGKKLGATTATVSSGRASRTVTVAVDEWMPPLSVTLEDANSTMIPFSAGHYLVIGDFEGTGVTAEWAGAPCTGTRETRQLATSCDVASTANLTLTNPDSWGWGPTATGAVVVVKLALPTGNMVQDMAERFRRIAEMQR